MLAERVEATTLQYLIADMVAMLVVDVLEAVDIDHGNAEARTGPPQLGGPCLQTFVEIASVGDLRQRVDHGELLEFLDPTERRDCRRVVAEEFHGADDLAGTVTYRGDLHSDRDVVSLAVLEEDLRLVSFLVTNGSHKRATQLTKGVPHLVNVSEDVVVAVAVDHLVGRVAGYRLRHLVPIGDPAFSVDEVDPVAYFVKDCLVARLGRVTTR